MSQATKDTPVGTKLRCVDVGLMQAPINNYVLKLGDEYKLAKFIEDRSGALLEDRVIVEGRPFFYFANRFEVI